MAYRLSLIRTTENWFFVCRQQKKSFDFCWGIPVKHCDVIKFIHRSGCQSIVLLSRSSIAGGYEACLCDSRLRFSVFSAEQDVVFAKANSLHLSFCFRRAKMWLVYESTGEKTSFGDYSLIVEFSDSTGGYVILHFRYQWRNWSLKETVFADTCSWASIIGDREFLISLISW